ncbi:14743_t:CDS:2 [Dentiscutata erythropus]|uniref:mitogen-activated protein kinase kinase n=1 Tax=Dentiscutata erythropus TaxID=1348616 RepID=A0A9N9E7W9_9GLOM|nr:14743_t:CDS:2 [Dentiscutata erythropus]
MASEPFSRENDASAQINPAHLKELEKQGKITGDTVTKVYDTVKKVVMLKKKIDIIDDSEFISLCCEIDFLKKCHSPNIITYYGAVLEDNSISIFMEFCEGGSLDKIYKHVRRRQGRIGEPVLGKIGESVLKGLIYLYSQHIFHRDIQPSKIVVTRRGEIKICDFGYSGDIPSYITTNSNLCTSYYVAPERIQGQKYKVSADVWSLGLTLMEVAQNEFPYPYSPTVSPFELVVYIVNSLPPVLKDEYDWSSEFRDFLKISLNISLEKDGEKRPTPKQILDHPFIWRSASREIPMHRWIKEVWEWDD